MAHVPDFLPVPQLTISIPVAINALHRLRHFVMNNIHLFPHEGAQALDDIEYVMTTVLAVRPLPGINRKFPRTSYDVYPYLGRNITEVAVETGASVDSLRRRAHSAGLDRWIKPANAGSLLVIGRDLLNVQIGFGYFPYAVGFGQVRERMSQQFHMEPNAFTVYYARDGEFILIGDNADVWTECVNHYLQNVRRMHCIELLIFPHNQG